MEKEEGQRKYEFVDGDTITIAPGRTVKRIRALVAIAALGIMPGELGGYIEAESNLSGNAWVSGDARVYGDAQVHGDARVYGDAQVSGNARVYGDAQVYGNARVYGNAQVSGNARVYGDAQVSGDASNTPLQISGLTWQITISDTRMVIGCQEHEISAWWSMPDEDIARMHSQALEFWRNYKDIIFGLIRADGRFDGWGGGAK